METDITGRLGRLEERQTRSEADIEDLRRQVGRLEADMAELRQELAEMRTDMTTGFSEIKQALADVVTGALNSMPQWAASTLRTHSMLVGALGGLLAAAVSALLWLLPKR